MSSNSEAFGKCKKQGCGCQIFRQIPNSINEQCYFCEHGSGFHEILSEINTSIYMFGLCHKNGTCECQRFKEDVSNTEKCLYCNHFFAFHQPWDSQCQVNITPSSTIPSQLLHLLTHQLIPI
ncbi:hypothetical protein C1646_758931 [Rhizophagus diaphanus]|nr:hypothetical protein C1646_758931 [Rhizophagus diaphanus] [Rhizophagus sp. MUCL 43196]